MGDQTWHSPLGYPPDWIHASREAHRDLAVAFVRTVRAGFSGGDPGDLTIADLAWPDWESGGQPVWEGSCPGGHEHWPVCGETRPDSLFCTRCDPGDPVRITWRRRE